LGGEEEYRRQVGYKRYAEIETTSQCSEDYKNKYIFFSL